MRLSVELILTGLIIFFCFICLQNFSLGSLSDSNENELSTFETDSNQDSSNITATNGSALFLGSTNLTSLPPVNYSAQAGKERSFEDFVSEDKELFLDLKKDSLINKNVTKKVFELPLLIKNFNNLTSTHPSLNFGFLSNDSLQYAANRNITVPLDEGSGSGINATGFSGMISNQSCSYCHPPDTTIGVGRANLVQMINNYVSVFSKDSSQLERVVTLNDLYGLRNNDNTSDPYVLYDNTSRKWFSSIMLINEGVNNTAILAAVSRTDEPLGIWNTFKFNVTNINSTLYCPDRPVIGTSGDKVVISANVISPDANGSCYNHAEGAAGYMIIVVDKNQMTTSSPNSKLNTAVFHGTGWITMIPAKNNEVNDIYLVSVGTQNTKHVKLLKIENLYPNVKLVCSLHEFNGATNIPPDAKQPNTPILIDTADSRILDASYNAGKISLAFNEGCLPMHDNEPRSCLRLMQLNVANSSQYQDCNFTESVNARVLKDIDIGHDETYYYRPALQTDGQGNLFVVFGFSSNIIYPSLAVLKIDKDDEQMSNITSKLIKEGTRNTEAERLSLGNDTKCNRQTEFSTSFSYACSRYGDYFSAVLDPVDPNTVWIAGQYYENKDYSTYIAKVASSDR
jgi:hypothetical protein